MDIKVKKQLKIVCYNTSVINKIYRPEPGSVCPIIERMDKPYLIITFPELDLDSIEVHNKLEAETLMDLVYYLTRLNFLSPISRGYRITGDIKDVPSSPDIHTKEETELINEY